MMPAIFAVKWKSGVIPLRLLRPCGSANSIMLFCANYTSGVLEHKWRASLKLQFFLPF